MFAPSPKSKPPAEAAESSPHIADLLDAFGRILAAYAQGSFDLPGRPASETVEELERWRRHSVLGTPLNDGPHLGSAQRDFSGAARALSEHRRSEKQFVEAALKDLREALWACVQRVHVAVQADLEADVSTATQIDRVQTAIHRLETGEVKNEVLDALTKIEEIVHVRQASQKAAYSSLAERIESMGSQLDVAVRESETDPLTALGNRKRFAHMAERAVHMHALQRSSVTLILMDLDGLKQINDSLGHAAGDAVLKTFATCLPKVFLRDSDELCRIGGDEFVALLPNTSQDLAGRLADRVAVAFAGTTPPHGDAGPLLSVSIGYAELHAGEDVARWMARADAAMYRAKSNGKGRAEAA